MSEELRDFIWSLDLSDARLVEQAFLLCENYEAAHICQQRIETRIDDLLEGFGFNC